MLQGDAIREITLEGPGAGGVETASAVVADMVSIIGTTATGFLQNEPSWRTLERLEPGELRSPFYVHLEVDDRPGVLAHVARRLAAHDISVARLVQAPVEGGAVLHVVVHETPQRAIDNALQEIVQLPEVHARPSVLPVVSDRGVAEMGWA
jgi:homoserine dehydrogenase